MRLQQESQAIPQAAGYPKERSATAIASTARRTVVPYGQTTDSHPVWQRTRKGWIEYCYLGWAPRIVGGRAKERLPETDGGEVDRVLQCFQFLSWRKGKEREITGGAHGKRRDGCPPEGSRRAQAFWTIRGGALHPLGRPSSEWYKQRKFSTKSSAHP